VFKGEDKESEDGLADLMYDAIRVALDTEDQPVATSIQRKLEAGLVDGLIYGRNELILHHNHDGWDAALGEPRPRASPRPDGVAGAWRQPQ
jgi:hypothetical protein